LAKKVRRSSGEIEDGWGILSILEDGWAKVYKKIDGENKQMITKEIPLQELAKINQAEKVKEIEPSGLELEKDSDQKEFEDIDEKIINEELDEVGKKSLSLESEDKEKVGLEIETKQASAKKIIEALNADSEKIDAEAKEKGYADIMWGAVEKYRSLSFKKKMLISAGFAGMAGASTLIGGTIGTTMVAAAIAGNFGQRVFGGLATFVALEGILNKKAEEKVSIHNEQWEKDWEKNKNTAIAAVAGIAVASGVVGKGIGYAFEQTGAGEWLASVWGGNELPASQQISEQVKETPLSVKLSPEEIASLKEGGDIPPPPPIENDTVSKIEADLEKMYGKEDFSPLSPEEKTVLDSDIKSAPHPVEALGSTQVYEVKPGDNLWNIIKKDFEAKGLFKNLQEGQKTHLIDYMKDRFAEMSPEQLRGVGISSGNIDKLSVGDKLSLSGIVDKESNIVDAMDKTLGLSPEQIQNIENYSPESPTDKIPEQVIHTDAPGVAVEQVAPGKDIPVTPEDMQRAMGGDVVSHEPAPENTVGAVSPEVVEEALRSEVDTLFGRKGFLGLGASNGIETPEWKTIQKMTVPDLLAQASAEVDDYVDLIEEDTGLKEKMIQTSSYLETIGNSNLFGQH